MNSAEHYAMRAVRMYDDLLRKSSSDLHKRARRVLLELSLFDTSAKVDVLDECFWSQCIDGLSDGERDRDGKALEELARLSLVSIDKGDGMVNTHPLIRGYFDRLNNDPTIDAESDATARQHGFNALFEYLQLNRRFQPPADLESLQRSLEVVKYGCRAKRYQDAYTFYRQFITPVGISSVVETRGALPVLISALRQFVDFEGNRFFCDYDKSQSLDDEQRYHLLMHGAICYMSTEGFACDSSCYCYDRAADFAAVLKRSDYQFSALVGGWRVRLVRAELGRTVSNITPRRDITAADTETEEEPGQSDNTLQADITAGDFVEKIKAIADSNADGVMQMVAKYAELCTAFFCGELSRVDQLNRELLEKPLSSDERSKIRRSLMVGYDPFVISHIYQSWTDWHHGEFHSARKNVERGIAAAKEICDPVNEVIAYFFAAGLGQFLGDLDLLREQCDAVVKLADEMRNVFFLYGAWFLQSWDAAESDPCALKRMADELSNWEKTKAKIVTPYFRTLLAERYLRHRDVEHLRNRKDEPAAKTMGEIKHVEGWWAPEVQRVGAMVGQMLGTMTTTQVTKQLWDALALCNAPKLSSFSLAVRVLNTLGRLTPSDCRVRSELWSLLKSKDFLKEDVSFDALSADVREARALLGIGSLDAGNELRLRKEAR